MFYVTSFFHVFLNKPIKTLLSLTSALTFILSLSYQNEINLKLSAVVNKKSNQESYFSFLIKKHQNYNSVTRKLLNLPGVQSVFVDNEKSLANKLSEVSLANKISLDYIGVKVLFNRGLKQESIHLVLNYLKHLVSSKNLIIGRVHNYQKTKEKVSLVGISWGISFILFIIFVIFFNNWTNESSQYSYLIEQYQNLKYVNFKISSTFFLLILILGLGIGLILKIKSLPMLGAAIGLIFITTFILSVKKSWQY